MKHDASSDDIATTAASILQFFGVNASDFENMREGEEVAEATDVALPRMVLKLVAIKKTRSKCRG